MSSIQRAFGLRLVGNPAATQSATWTGATGHWLGNSENSPGRNGVLVADCFMDGVITGDHLARNGHFVKHRAKHWIIAQAEDEIEPVQSPMARRLRGQSHYPGQAG